MSYSAGVDLDWCLTCNRHLSVPNTSYCSPQCEPTPSQPIFNLCPDVNDWTHSDELEDDAIIYHVVHDTSSAKGIAAWAANVPTGAPPNDLPPLPYHPSSQPKLLHPQCARLAPPALSISESTTASIPLETPPPKDPSMFSSLAHHIRSFVSSSSAGFPVNKLTSRTKKHLRNSMVQLPRRDSSLYSDSFEEELDSNILSPLEERDDLWWITDSDASSTISSVFLKKSAAQSIAPSESKKHQLDCEMFFQPKILPVPIELSSKMQASAHHVDEDELSQPRGRQGW